MQPLSRFAEGDRIIVRRLEGGGTFVSRMAALGIVPGTTLTVLQNRGALVVRGPGTRVALGRGEAERIWGEKVGEAALSAEGAPSPSPEPKRYVIALAGQPNVGKSTLFNLLTGLNQHVGNWPGKTVEKKTGFHRYREDVLLEFIDLPGTYSLTANSEEERIARDFIIHERPDVVVLVANAAQLERGLYLLAEVLALPVPVILALNMMDLAEQEGIRVEAHVLEAALGLPVIPLVASRNQGVRELLETVVALAENPARFQPRRPELDSRTRDLWHQVQELIAGLVPTPYPPDWVALKLLEGDREITDKVRAWLPEERWRTLSDLLHTHEDAVLAVVNARYEWIARLLRAALHQPRGGQISLTDRIDRIATHPFWGLLALLAVLGLVFYLTYAVALPLQEWLDAGLVAFQDRVAAWLQPRWPPWAVALVTEGVLGGAGTVLTFLPVLAVFFVIMAVLEDSGYLARAAFVMDRFMHAIGLHGKSFLPLFLGFGCNVPAVLGTRILESPLSRLLTILLIPLVPCSARWGVLTFLAPVFFGRQAPWVAWGLVAFNLLLVMALGWLLSRTLLRGGREAFIMELPLYHWPVWRNVGLAVWHHCLEFLKRAGGIILAMSAVIWALSHYPGPGVAHSWLAAFGRALAPLGALMGMDWRLLVALLTGFVAKENVVATLGVLYHAEGSGLRQVLSEAVPLPTALAFLVVTMVYIPCLATVIVIRQETGSWRWTLFDMALTLTLAFGLGIGVYRLAAWWLGC
ncbi:ferrous iron transport protein B [Methylomarinovum tepidoasis]|uniref:ferrous iron transport protein B n=1 Tax=Methylomarinovum tepidoasis TaxID=2840183 RepID=UPI00257429D4|nr:ferrous iron transport protein B [Methylomarinovum sp. IN45]